MNIFAVHQDPRRAARALCDRHVVRMTLETAQILCTVAWQAGLRPPYRPTHARHPCVRWAAANTANWSWLVAHGLALAEEFTRRFGKRHASEDVLRWILAHRAAPDVQARRRTPFAQAMPEAYRGPSAVEAYRRYYLAEKARFATWRAPARPPSWWQPEAKRPRARVRLRPR